MHPLGLFFLLLTLLAPSTPDHLSTAGVDFILNEPIIDFGNTITFDIQIHTASNVEESTLFIQPGGQETHLQPFSMDSTGNNQVVYDVKVNPLRPFSATNYWVQIKLENGDIFTSSSQEFFYEDNQYSWQRLEQDNIQVAWVDGDIQFGQDLINTAQASLSKIGTIFSKEDKSQKIRIYNYPDAQSLQNSLAMTDTPWAAGHSSPDLGVILLSIAPDSGQMEEMERLLPHEMMHLYQYQVVTTAYTQIPAWLIEGMASMVEIYPNQEYQRVLEKAGQESLLLPMASLCGAFPKDLSSAYLAYAQSESFVRYLYQMYGGSGLTQLLDTYQDGTGCQEGFRLVFNETLPQAESQWIQEWMGNQYTNIVWKNLTPYGLLALLILGPISIVIFTTSLKRKTSKGSIPHAK